MKKYIKIIDVIRFFLIQCVRSALQHTNMGTHTSCFSLVDNWCNCQAVRTQHGNTFMDSLFSVGIGTVLALEPIVDSQLFRDVFIIVVVISLSYHHRAFNFNLLGFH